MVKKEKTESDADVYGELDASKTLLFHGLESDIIEEQMSEDKEFRWQHLKINLQNYSHTELDCSFTIFKYFFQERSSRTESEFSSELSKFHKKNQIPGNWK